MLELLPGPVSSTHAERLLALLQYAHSPTPISQGADDPYNSVCRHGDTQVLLAVLSVVQKLIESGEIIVRRLPPVFLSPYPHSHPLPLFFFLSLSLLSFFLSICRSILTTFRPVTPSVEFLVLCVAAAAAADSAGVQ